MIDVVKLKKKNYSNSKELEIHYLMRNVSITLFNTLRELYAGPIKQSQLWLFSEIY